MISPRNSSEPKPMLKQETFHVIHSVIVHSIIALGISLICTQVSVGIERRLISPMLLSYFSFMLLVVGLGVYLGVADWANFNIIYLMSALSHALLYFVGAIWWPLGPVRMTDDDSILWFSFFRSGVAKEVLKLLCYLVPVAVGRAKSASDTIYFACLAGASFGVIETAIKLTDVSANMETLPLYYGPHAFKSNALMAYILQRVIWTDMVQILTAAVGGLILWGIRSGACWKILAPTVIVIPSALSGLYSYFVLTGPNTDDFVLQEAAYALIMIPIFALLSVNRLHADKPHTGAIIVTEHPTVV